MPEIYGTRSRKMEVTYDYYRIFYYAAKYKSFSQAATILMSNQPNVTRAIHNLESQLGCRLFIRSNRGAELTPEGERLYSHVAIAYDHLHAAELELENEKKLENFFEENVNYGLKNSAEWNTMNFIKIWM